MENIRPRTKSELKKLYTNLKSKGITDDMMSDLIEACYNENPNSRTSGFETPGGTDAVISFDPALRIFTIAPFDPVVEDWQPRYGIYTWAGKPVFHRLFDTIQIEIPNTEGLYLLYFDINADTRLPELLYMHQPNEAQAKEIYLTRVIVTWLYWDYENQELLYFGDDRHGSEWQPQMQRYLHLAFGARRKAGLQFSGYVLNGDGSSSAHAQFSITAGTMLHDDIELAIPGSSNTLPVLYCFGGLPRFLLNNGYAIAEGGRVYYNNAMNNVAQADSGNFVLYHIFATNEIAVTQRKTISVMGTAQYTDLADVYKGIESELDDIFTYLPQQGRCYLGSIIIQTSDEYTNDVKARIVAITGNTQHPPVTIAEVSKALASINEKQELTITPEAPVTAKRLLGRYATTSGLKQEISIGNNLKLTDAGVLQCDFVVDTFTAANEAELLQKWALAIATGKNCTIYIVGIINLTANRTFNRAYGEPWIQIEGAPFQTINIGNYILETSYVHYKNLSFTTASQVYLYNRDGYMEITDCYFHSEVVYNSDVSQMKKHIVVIGTAVNATGGIQLTGIRHASQNIDLNNSGDIQPIIIENQAIGFQNLYIELTYLHAMISYDRFSRLLILATVTAGFRITGDLSWYYHPVQNFTISANLLKKGSVDDLRADYIPSGNIVKHIGIDANNKIVTAAQSTGNVTPANLSAEFNASVALSGTDVNWATGVRFTKTITGNTTLTFSNIHVGVKFFEITGNYAITLPSGFTFAGGTRSATGVTLIQVVCTSTSGPVGWFILLKSE